jgi:3-hydroxybutyryl-CoA dehydrogenase
VLRVAVIGAGAAGRAFALRCAGAGFAVTLEDVMPEKLRRAQDDYTSLAAGAGEAGSLRVALTVEDAVQDADIAIDFVPDELESKLEIFSLLDRMAPPRTILCTPTQTLSITDMASCTYRPGLCVGLRSGNLIEGLVDVLRSRFAQAAALATVQELLQRMGLESRVVEDHEEPMLVKNMGSAVRN